MTKYGLNIKTYPFLGFGLSFAKLLIMAFLGFGLSFPQSSEQALLNKHSYFVYSITNKSNSLIIIVITCMTAHAHAPNLKNCCNLAVTGYYGVTGGLSTM